MSKTIRLSSIKECTYHVKGMHCASCELLIENKLLKSKSVESVEASTSNAKIAIFYQTKKPSIEQLNKKFEKEGYSFSLKPFKDKQEIPFISLTKSGQLLINKNKLFHHLQILSITLFLIVGFVFLSRSGFVARVAVSSSSALPGASTAFRLGSP